MSTRFWNPLWRGAGIRFVVLFIIAYFVYGQLTDAFKRGLQSGEAEYRCAVFWAN